MEHNGELLARWPYVVKKRLGFTVLTVPPFTPRLGPWLKSTGGKYSTQLARQKEALTSLCERMPPHDILRAGLSLALTNWLPLYWRGFTAKPLYTYRIQDITNESLLWSELTEAARRAIRKASQRVIVEHEADPGELLDLHIRTFTRRGQHARCDLQMLLRIIDACKQHAGCSVLVGKEKYGPPRAGMLLIWDRQTAYYLVGGFDPAMKGNAAMSLVVWEALKLARKVTAAFDFEGSMIETIEHFFRGFGARQTLYLWVEHTSRRARIVRGIAELCSLRHVVP